MVLYMLCLVFLVEEHINKKTEIQKKIDRDSHVCGLDLLGSGGLFQELEYGTYLTCCFIQFFSKIIVIFVHLVLWVDFFIDCTKKSEVVPVWLE